MKSKRSRGAAAGALALACLALGACGEDEPTASRPTQDGGGTQVKSLVDVKPRAAKANFVGGDAPVEEFIRTVADDAAGYWGRVHEASGLPYEPPEVATLSKPADNGCGEPIDPARQPLFVCSGGRTLISLSLPILDRIKRDVGDGAVAYVVGLAFAFDTAGRVSGGAGTEEQGVCFAGAWIRDVGDRSLLEQGDDREVAAAAKALLADPAAAVRQLQTGYDGGVEAC